MLKYRLLSFPLLLGILALIFFSPEKYGAPVFAFAAAAMIAAAVTECAKMLDKIGIGTLPRSAGVVAFMIMIAGSKLGLGISAFWILMFGAISLAWLSLLVSREKFASKVFNTAGILALLVIPYMMLTGHYYEDPLRLLFIILATKAMDTGGYIFGMISGKLLPGGNHKLCPSVSPKKSWEGALGGVILSLAVGWAFYKYAGGMSLTKYLVFSGIFALASILGDLTESALKRRCGVKDSGSWIPGMGGALDVLDSFIYTGFAALPLFNSFMN